MIDLKKLKPEDVGRWVTYQSFGGDKKERGKLKSWNSTFIFVVYNANNNWNADHWKDYTAAATDPNDLTFE